MSIRKLEPFKPLLPKEGTIAYEIDKIQNGGLKIFDTEEEAHRFEMNVSDLRRRYKRRLFSVLRRITEINSEEKFYVWILRY